MTDSHNSLLVDTALITAAFFVGTILVNPVGDFPLIDDWAYHDAVEHFVRTGDYRPFIASATLFTNVLWGSLFALIGGPSFTTLRISSLIASVFGVLGVYILVRDLQKPRWLALTAAATLCFSPAYFALSHTFMTDVLFTATVTWSSVFFSRSFNYSFSYHMVLGTMLALAATLSRQVGLSVPISFAIVSLLRRENSPITMLRSCSPLAICIAALFGFDHWLDATGRVPILYHNFTHMLFQVLGNGELLVSEVFENTYTTIVHLGLFLLPVLLCTTADLMRLHRMEVIVFSVVGAFIMTLAVCMRAHYGDEIVMPLPFSHVLVRSGIGLLWLPDVERFQINNMPALPNSFWLLVTVMALIGSALLIAQLAVHARHLAPNLFHRKLADLELTGLFNLLSAIVCLAPYLVVDSQDRYLTPTVPFLLGATIALSRTSPSISSKLNRYLRRSAHALLAALSYFTISGTHDYLEWNRVSWVALQYATDNEHIAASTIDGGIEFNFMHGQCATSGALAQIPRVSAFERAHPNRFSGMPAEDLTQIERLVRCSMGPSSPDHIIAFGPVPGYVTIRKYSYFHWLPPHEQPVLLLRRL